jgi:hypothetical protein
LLLTAVLEEGDEHTLKKEALSLLTFDGVVPETKSPLAVIVNVAAGVMLFLPGNVCESKKTLLLLGFRFCAMGSVAYLPTRATYVAYLLIS